MRDPTLQHLTDDSAAHQRELDAARADFREGRRPRWARVGGQLVDLAPPLAPPAVFPTGTLTHEQGLAIGAQVKSIDEAAAAKVPCCPTCGQRIGGDR